MIKNTILFLSFLCLSIYAQSTIHIPADYSTIQAGLNAASEGDIVLVSAGTYYENIIWPNTNGIKLLSTDKNNTFINGNESRVILIDNTEPELECEIRGFMITNGSIPDFGAGIYVNNSNVILEDMKFYNNKITKNTLGDGIAIYSKNSTITLNRCIFSENEHLYSFRTCAVSLFKGRAYLDNIVIENNMSGGIRLNDIIYSANNILINNNNAIGINFERATLDELNNCTIINNRSPLGGVLIGNCYVKNLKVIANNNTNTGGVNYYGGGVSLGYGGIIDSSIIVENIASTDKGGGIYASSGGKKIVKNSLIYNNFSIEKAPLVYVDMEPSSEGLEFINCTFVLTKPTNQPAVFCEQTLTGFNISNSNFINLGNAVSSLYFQIDAKNNYWDDPAGPFHPNQNPGGIGDSVNKFVNIIPWLTEPNIDAPPIPILNIEIINTNDHSISLLWEKSIIGDLSGYKIYYDTDSTNWEFNNSIDVGLDTNYTLTNLSIGQKYYIAVTCYDNDGNESWYSETISTITTPAPIISTGVNKINFGDVNIGDKSDQKVVIENIGTDDLIVSRIQTSSTVFFANVSEEIVIKPSSSSEIYVSFKPTRVGEFEDELTIISNANNIEKLSIMLHGSGVLSEEPKIISISDVPNDQGGNVRIEFSKSRYDQNDLNDSSITTYSVWRLNSNTEWDAVGLFNADRSEKYNFVSPTLGDSTVNGIVWSIFKVSAHAVNPDIFYYSENRTGYSIDNIAPAIPEGLNITNQNDRVELKWKNNEDADFQYYKIYRSITSEFIQDSAQTSNFTTINTTYIDNEVDDGIQYYYKVSAVDYAGNESECSEIVIAVVTDVDEEPLLPTKYELEQNFPNPFNPTTTIVYQLPEQGFVSLKVYDMLGKEVASLVDETKDGGRYNVNFNASNLASGVYIYRITIKALEGGSTNFTQTNKLLLLK